MEQEKKRWRHIGKGTTLHLKIAGLFRDIEDVHKVGRVRGVWRSIAVAHLLAIAMVGSNKKLATER